MNSAIWKQKEQLRKMKTSFTFVSRGAMQPLAPIGFAGIIRGKDTLMK